MKSIVVAHVILIATCVWGELSEVVHPAQIVRPPLKYWIENVEFSRDEEVVSTGSKATVKDTNRGGSDDESLTKRTGSTSRVEVHAGGEITGGVTATRSGINPKVEAKLNAGGSVKKEWTKEEIRERRKRQFVSNSDVEKQEALLKWSAGNCKLKTTIIIENQSTNVTYVYDAVADSPSRFV